MLLTLLEKMIDRFYAVLPRAQPKPDQIDAAHLIAHRGAHDLSQGIIENTLSAFRVAEKAGCWGIELDVHATADQVLVVNHDSSLQRLWGHNLLIEDLNFADLRAKVPEIPTLAEVIAEFGQRLHLFIELKKIVSDEEVLVHELHGLEAGEDYHLIMLDAAIAHSLSQFPKQALLLVASYNNTAKLCQLSLKEHYAGVLGHYLLLTTQLVNGLKSKKQQIGVGFVDSKYSLYRELTRGIQWIFTNRAVQVSACLKSLTK